MDPEQLSVNQEGKTISAFRNLPPTDRDKVNKKNVNTGTGSPQLALKVWRSSSWKEFANVFPIAVAAFGLIVGFFAMGSGNPEEKQLGTYIFVGSLLFALLIFPLRFLGKHTYRLGFDLKTNTLWCARSGKGVIGLEYDVNKITHFSYADASTSSTNYRWYSDPTQVRYYVNKKYNLTCGRIGSEFEFAINGSALATKKEAKKVAAMANNLLQTQL